MAGLTDAQLDWLANFTGTDRATLAASQGVHVPIDQAGAVLNQLGDDTPTATGGGRKGGAPAGTGADDIQFQRDGPMLRVPMNPDGTPIRGIEINAGRVDTDVGLPPDPVTGDFVDPSLIDLHRTDIAPQRSGADVLNANEPIPPEMQGQYDFALSNNPKGYTPDLKNVADLVKPGGRVIVQGRTPANPEFSNMLNEVAPRLGKDGVMPGPLKPPPGTSVVPEMVDAAGNPMPFRPGGTTVHDGQTLPEAVAAGQKMGGQANPADIMGKGFRYTEGDPTPQGPNARLILQKDLPPASEPPASEPPTSEPPVSEPPVPKSPPPETPVAETPVAKTPVTETPVAEVPVAEVPVTEPPVTSSAPASNATAAVEGEAAAGAEAGVGSAVKGGLLGAGIAAGIQVAQDWDKVKSGQMSVGDAAIDVGGKAGEVGALTVGGTVIADLAAGAGGAEAGALGATASTVASVATKGGVIGGVVAGGMALIDDIGKVKSGEMTGGTATVDVAAKTAVGVGAGLAGAAAGAEIGAIAGSVVPGLGNAVGFVAGAVVGGAVGYVGSKIMETETGRKVIHEAGKAVDAAIDGVEAAGKVVAKEATAAAHKVEEVVSDAGKAVAKEAEAVVDKVEDAGKAVAKEAEAAVNKVEEVVADAGKAVSDGASKAVDAVENAASGAWDKVTSLF